MSDAPNDAQFEQLLAELDALDKTTRENAVKALGELGDKRAVEPLIRQMLRDLDTEYTQAGKYAAGALATIGDARAIDAIMEGIVKWGRWHWGWLITSLYDFGAPARIRMIEYTQHPDPAFQEAAFDVIDWCIQYGRSKWEILMLLTAIKSNNPNHRVRAMNVLENLPGEKVLEKLEQALQAETDEYAQQNLLEVINNRTLKYLL